MDETETKPTCSSCKATETPQWRRFAGEILCNACGVRLSRNRTPTYSVSTRLKRSPAPTLTRPTIDASSESDEPHVATPDAIVTENQTLSRDVVEPVEPIEPVEPMIIDGAFDGFDEHLLEDLEDLDKSDASGSVHPSSLDRDGLNASWNGVTIQSTTPVEPPIGDIALRSLCDDSPVDATIYPMLEWDDRVFDALVPISDIFPHPWFPMTSDEKERRTPVRNEEYDALREAHDAFLVESVTRLAVEKEKSKKLLEENRRNKDELDRLKMKFHRVFSTGVGI